MPIVPFNSYEAIKTLEASFSRLAGDEALWSLASMRSCPIPFPLLAVLKHMAILSDPRQ